MSLLIKTNCYDNQSKQSKTNLCSYLWGVEYFLLPISDVSPFVLVAIHADPDMAVEELNALVPVHASIEKVGVTVLVFEQLITMTL